MGTTQKIVIANWKSNPATADEAMMLARASDVPGLIIAPPTAYLPIVSKLLQHARIASQNFESAAASYTIIGHSDYRARGETDEQIAQKIKSALEAGIAPILCVGEPRDVHASGRAKEFVKSQLEKDLAFISVLGHPSSVIRPRSSVLIAYEPIWSISTTPGATPDDPINANNMIQYIKELLSKTFHVSRFTFHVLYGGSVNEINAESFLAMPSIDGLLVGAASLRSESIKKTVEIAAGYRVRD